MAAIEEMERKLLALPQEHRVFRAEWLLASVPRAGNETTEAEEMKDSFIGSLPKAFA